MLLTSVRLWGREVRCMARSRRRKAKTSEGMVEGGYLCPEAPSCEPAKVVTVSQCPSCVKMRRMQLLSKSQAKRTGREESHDACGVGRLGIRQPMPVLPTRVTRERCASQSTDKRYAHSNVVWVAEFGDANRSVYQALLPTACRSVDFSHHYAHPPFPLLRG